jgi:hypothetical protein
MYKETTQEIQAYEDTDPDYASTEIKQLSVYSVSDSVQLSLKGES